MILKKKYDELQARMYRLGIQEQDLVEKFILGSGRGGQKINKTASCVYLKHLPTGIEIKCQKERSRELNRYSARKELCDKLESQTEAGKLKEKATLAKIRRQKRKRLKRTQAKLLVDKRKISEKKSLRGTPRVE